MSRLRPAAFKPELKILPPYVPSGQVVVNPQMLIMARRSRSVELSEVSERTGISIHRLRRMENGKLDPTHQEVEILSDAYYYPQSLFFEEGKIEPITSVTFREAWDEAVAA